MLQQEQGLCERGKNMKELNVTFGSVLLSATDFFEFCQMMYDVNQGEEVVFCPPLIDCCEDFAEAESKSCGESKEEGYDDMSKSQRK